MLGEIALRIVWAMLAECAPDHAVEEKLHHYWVRYKGRRIGRCRSVDAARAARWYRRSTSARWSRVSLSTETARNGIYRDRSKIST